MKKVFKVLGAVAVIAAVVIGGWYFFAPEAGEASFSATGTTNTTAKIASKVMSLSSASATSTSIYNNSGFDWGVESSFAVCNEVGTSRTAYSGGGLAALVMRMATTSSDAPAVVSNTNYAMDLTIATSSAVTYNATSTEGVIFGYSRIIPNGTYATFFSNATNTASCTVGIHYLNL